MSELLPEGESSLRLIFFLGIFALMAIWELALPRRRPGLPRRVRWPSNLGILALNAALLRVVFPAAATGLALIAETRGWGILNNLPMSQPLNKWVAVALSVILLDLAIYLQHVMFHAVPAFWRLHRMHHTDVEFDVSTGGRFHPVEILLSMVIKMGLVAALGPPVAGVVIFEILLNGTSLFNHANVRIPTGADRAIRWLVVTPDMHRVHHSVHAEETNSNFGFNLPWWDRLLGTYRAQPRDGHGEMKIGIGAFRDRGEYRLDRMLIQPVRRGPGLFAIADRAGAEDQSGRDAHGEHR